MAHDPFLQLRRTGERGVRSRFSEQFRPPGRKFSLFTDQVSVTRIQAPEQSPVVCEFGMMRLARRPRLLAPNQMREIVSGPN